MKEEIKNPETSVEYSIQKQWERIASVVENTLLTKIQVYQKIIKIN